MRTKKDSKIADIALLLLYPYSILTGMSEMQGVHIIYPATVLSIFVYIFIGKTCDNKKLYKRFIVLLIGIFAFLVINLLIVGNVDEKNIVYGVFILPSIGALLFFYKVKYWVSIVLFYTVNFFLGAYVYENGFIVTESTDILLNSRNYMSYFAILYSLPYFIHCSDYNKTPHIIVPSICVLIAIYSLGRTGILASLLLMTGVLYINMLCDGKYKKFYRFSFCFFVGFLLFIGFDDEFFNKYFSRFVEVGIESAGRTPGWKEYLSSLINPINLFVGTNIDSLKYVSSNLNGSLHNSFLTLHAREGIMGFFLTFYMIKAMWFLLIRKCYSVFCVLFSLLFKGLTDADMGGTYSGGDIYVFYLVLIYYQFKNKYERKSSSPIPASVSSNTRK